MRIGFLGNANNYPFMVARAFRKLGHEIVFIVDSAALLNRPENLYKDDELTPYPSWIMDFSPLNIWEFEATSSKVDKILATFSNCDFVVLNEFALQNINIIL